MGTLWCMRRYSFLPILALLVRGAAASGAQEPSLDFLNRLMSEPRPGPVSGSAPPRIRPGDGSASAALYDALQAHAENLSAAVRTGQDMVSYARVWEGYLEILAGHLERIRELTLRTYDGLTAPEERGILEFEIDLLYDGVLRTLERAEFNGRPLFGPRMGDERIRGIFSEARFRDAAEVDAMLASVRSERARLGAAISAAGFPGGPDALRSGSVRFLAEFFRLELEDGGAER